MIHCQMSRLKDFDKSGQFPRIQAPKEEMKENPKTPRIHSQKAHVGFHETAEGNKERFTLRTYPNSLSFSESSNVVRRSPYAIAEDQDSEPDRVGKTTDPEIGLGGDGFWQRDPREGCDREGRDLEGST